MSGALGRGSVRFVPRESRLEDAHLFGDVGEEGGALVGGGRGRRDLAVLVVLLLVELPLLALPLGEALILAPLKFHERTREGRNRVFAQVNRQ